MENKDNHGHLAVTTKEVTKNAEDPAQCLARGECCFIRRRLCGWCDRRGSGDGGLRPGSAGRSDQNPRVGRGGVSWGQDEGASDADAEWYLRGWRHAGLREAGRRQQATRSTEESPDGRAGGGGAVPEDRGE